MTNKEQTYTIKIDAELSSLQDKVARAKQSLDGLMSSGKAPKGLVSSFEKLESLLGRISDKSKQAPSKSLFSGIEKDLSNAELLFGEIVRGLESLKEASKDIKLELFPPESQAKIQAALDGLKEYQKILGDLKKKEAEVESARKASEKASKLAANAKQNKKEIKRSVEKKQTKRESLQGQIAVLGTEPEKNAIKIAELKGKVSELDLEIKNLTSDYNMATKALTEANKAAEEAKTKHEGLSKELEDLETDGLETLSASAKKAGRDIESIDGETPREKMWRLNNAIQAFVDNVLAGLPEGAQQAKTAMSNYAEAFSEATDKTYQAKLAEEEYQEALANKKAIEDRIKSFLGMAGVTKIVSASLRRAFEATKDLDEAMTEIAVVTNFDIGDMWDQLPEYTKRANELGISITEAYEASALFYQQGLKTNEVLEISNETLKMARIAGLDASEATDRMTAALRGFNMELNEASAQKISDVYSELAAITASDVDEISRAMTKTASIASSAGMEFETTAAFLSQIIETTRESAETAGTAMKTVIARFQELKKSPDEIGEVDGEIVDANAIETALRSVGVSLRDSSGQFRELDDVFLELSKKWNTLDKNTQRYIATIAAGSRQQSRFIAMMQDYNRTQELVSAANNSSGASQRQFEKTTESLKTKLTQLENAWNEFSTSLLNDEAIKFGVDLLTMFITALNKATDTFDGWMGSILKIGMILSLFRVATAIFNQFNKKITNIFTKTGEKIGEGIIIGMTNKKQETINTAIAIGKQVAKGAESAVVDKNKEHESPKTFDENIPEPVSESQPTRAQKALRTAIKVASAPKRSVQAIGRWASEKNRAMAKRVLTTEKTGADMVESQKKAKIAGDYANKGDEQRKGVQNAFAGARTGTAVSGLAGIGKEMNALALPLDSISEQYKTQMEAMGKWTEDTKEKWEKMRAEFEAGDVSAQEAINSINQELKSSGDDNGLQVTEEMQQESTMKAASPIESTPEVQNYINTTNAQTGLTAISSADEGTSMQQALATGGGGDMLATDLPIADIQTQFQEKMTALDMSIDEVNTSWQQLYNTITGGQSTASQALDLINQKMNETAQEALKAKQAAGGGAVEPTSAMQSASAGITVTGAIKDKAGNGAKAAQAKMKSASPETKEKAKQVKQQKKNKEEEDKAAKKQAKNSEKALADQEKMVDAYKETGESIAKMGAGLTMAGAGFSALGSKFEESGMDAAAQTFNTLGSFLGGVGSAMSVVGSVMSFITPLMTALTASTTAETVATGAQTAATSAQTAGFWAEAAAALGVQVACFPLIIITLAIVAALLILVAIILIVCAAFDAMAAASPEGQLKAAEEAAAAAAETAEKAAEAYDHLVEALEDLDGKYDALKDLTKGTKEWNKAVKDINKSVLDLIEEYPELAKFVENKEGVLTIDVDSDGVQAVVKEVESVSIAAMANSLYANKDVIDKENDLTYSDTAGDGDTSGGSAVKQAISDQGLASTDDGIKTMYQNIAKAVADGAIVQNGDQLSATISGEELSKYGLDPNQISKINSSLSGYENGLNNAINELREYGEALNEGQETFEASMEAIALSVEGAYDFSGWEESEVENAKNIYGGDIYDKYYQDNVEWVEDYKKQLGGESSESSQNLDKAIQDLPDEEEKYVKKAIEAKYGEGYSFKQGNIIDSEGTEYTIDEAKAKEIIQLAVHLKSKDESDEAIAATRYVIPELNELFGGDGQIGSRLFTDNGGALTGNDLDTLVDKDYLSEDGKLTGLDAMWESLGPQGKLAFGESKGIFKERISWLTTQQQENKKLDDQLEEIFGENLPENLGKLTVSTKKGIVKQTKEIEKSLERQGFGKDEIGQKIEEISKIWLEGAGEMPQHLQEMFSAQIASLDIRDADALTGFMIDLVEIYGFEEDAARELVDSIKEATLATSDWNTKILTYNALTEAQENLNSTLERQAELQWAYNLALEKGAVLIDGVIKSVKELAEEQILAYEEGVADSQEIYTNAQENLAIVYGSGLGRDSKNPNLNYMDFVDVSDEGKITVNWEKVGEYEQSNRIDMESFTEYVEDLQDISDTMEEAKEEAKEQIEALKELRDTFKESYTELRDLTKSAILNKIQEEIDLQDKTLTATKEAANNISSSLQSYINEQRQKDQNQKTEDSLEDSLDKQAYLAMDTSNANLLQLQQEQKAFEEKAEEYRNTLIDQSIQKLQDANEKAFSQRERQIAIAETQLELYENSAEFQHRVDTLMNDAMSQTDITNSQLYSLLDFQKTGMSTAEKAEWDNSISVQAQQASTWKITDWDGKIAALSGVVDTISSNIDASIKDQGAIAATKSKAHDLKNLGFDVEDYDTYTSDSSQAGGSSSATHKEYGNYLNTFDQYLNQSSEEDRTNAQTTANEINSAFGGKLGTINDGGNKVLTEDEYNRNIVTPQINAGTPIEDIQTYDEYVSGRGSTDAYNTLLTDVKENQKGKVGWFPLMFENWNNFAEGSGDDNELAIHGAGVHSDYVAFGELVPQAESKFLLDLMKKTYDETKTGHPLNDVSAKTPTGDAQGIYYNGKAYAYYNGQIREILAEQGGTIYGNVMDYPDINDTSQLKGHALLETAMLANAIQTRTYHSFKTGGLADFTGPAWLDGTPSKPEYILNADQTKHFFSLIDVLESYDDKKSSNKSGDNYFDIAINVEKLENDYDVEKVADKIRRMIYDDATYRNVNAINHIR